AYPDALLSDARLTGLEVRSELLHGPVSDSLLANAEATRADLIVMTSSGRGGISRALFGSVADALVRRTEIPVLLVRPLPDAHSARTPSSPRPIRRVLLPLDGSDAAERIIPHAIALAGTDGV